MAKAAKVLKVLMFSGGLSRVNSSGSCSLCERVEMGKLSQLSQLTRADGMRVSLMGVGARGRWRR